MDHDFDYTVLLTVTSTFTLDSKKPVRLQEQPKTIITIPHVTTATLKHHSTATSTSETELLFYTATSAEPKIQSAPSSFSQLRTKTLNSSDGNDLLKLGLSVGLPIAIISLFAISILAWYYLSRRHAQFATSSQYEDTFLKKNSVVKYDLKSEMPKEEGVQTTVRYSVRDTIGRFGKSFRDSVMFPINGRSNKLNGASPFVLRRFNLKHELEKPLPVIPSSQNSLPHMEKVVPSLDPKGVTSAARLVTKSYQKKLFDEISVEAGDIVRVIKDHSDGWSFIEMAFPVTDKIRTGRQGMVPSIYLKQLN